MQLSQSEFLLFPLPILLIVRKFVDEHVEESLAWEQHSPNKDVPPIQPVGVAEDIDERPPCTSRPGDEKGHDIHGRLKRKGLGMRVSGSVLKHGLFLPFDLDINQHHASRQNDKDTPDWNMNKDESINEAIVSPLTRNSSILFLITLGAPTRTCHHHTSIRRGIVQRERDTGDDTPQGKAQTCHVHHRFHEFGDAFVGPALSNHEKIIDRQAATVKGRASSTLKQRAL